MSGSHVRHTILQKTPEEPPVAQHSETIKRLIPLLLSHPQGSRDPIIPQMKRYPGIVRLDGLSIRLRLFHLPQGIALRIDVDPVGAPL